MSFIDEITSLFSVGEENGFFPSFKVSLIGGRGAYVEGVKKVVSFSSSEIVLELKKKLISLKGENLVIKKYSLGDMLVCGRIEDVRLK